MQTTASSLALDAAPSPSHTAGSGSAARDGQTRLDVAFTGSGSEYFRIWIVNLLLTLVTLGLYHPWAKVRKLRYFYGNTQVGGHALAFHGDPKRMLRGFLLVGALFVLYGIAGNVSPLAGLVAVVLVAAVWPALFRASMQFRLANTSWRGMRFQFGGSVAGAYKALLPALLPGLAFVALALVTGDPETAANATDGPAAQPPAWLSVAFGAVWLLAVATFPLLWWTIKRYQHDHYRFAGVQTQLRTGPGAFYGIFVMTLLISLLAMVAFMAIALVVMFVFGLAGGITGLFSGDTRASPGLMAAGTVLTMVLGYAVFVVLTQSYFTLRLQNLVWNRTKSTQVRFESALRMRALSGLTLKNWLLVLLTLGLYWPFAAVATARLKLEAVTVFTRRSPDLLLLSGAGAGDRDASGDAAADLFGIDFGW